MKSSLLGQLRNFNLPKRSGLIPLFEAVVNSVHAIEDRFSSASDVSNLGKISVHIHREDELVSLDFGPGRKPERAVVGFDVIDNGIGFNATNWDAFNHLHFTNKRDKGCRGVGRLTWLKAFDDVRISSHFFDDQTLKRRSFRFSGREEVAGGDPTDETDKVDVGTKVQLLGFRPGYAKAVEKTADAIAGRLLEHALWYFVRSAGVPSITLTDDQTDDAIDLHSLFDAHMHAGSAHQDLTIKGIHFDVTHVKFRARSDRKHVLAYCAGQRLVSEEGLELPGLTASVSDADGPYRYAGYIVSDFLDQRVVAERTGFDMEEEVDGLFADTEISRGDIRKAVKPLVSEFLGESLEANIQAGRDRLDEFVMQKAPHYLPIIRYMGEDELFVDPSTNDAQIDRELHSRKYQTEQRLLEEGERLLNPDLSDTVESYSARIAEYMDRLQSVKQSDLAAYVTHRRVVLDLLNSALNAQPDGSFERESVIHNLIMPMGSTSEDLSQLRASNLWLLNERLAFHQHYLGSDKSLSSIPITAAGGGKEPDLAGLNIYDNPHAFSDTTGSAQATITIVEIKKPMRKGYSTGEDKDPIEQALGYLRRVRSGGVMTKTGRAIPSARELPGYVYVLADLTDSMRERCEYATLNEAPDGQSYFGWNGSKNIKAYIEVIDFGGLFDAASQRNAAFFEFLGLGKH
ncbi:ATP-binding protein [Roseobacter sp. EG26]|uniref:hypothetical protein n=1 Tax=Roseobacter sp. EG26 TaxID=3412477 RepID=UPI003CE4E2D2